MSENVSLPSAVVDRIFRTTAKFTDAPPTVIELAHELARKVTEVVLQVLTVHPAGGTIEPQENFE